MVLMNRPSCMSSSLLNAAIQRSRKMRCRLMNCDCAAVMTSSYAGPLILACASALAANTDDSGGGRRLTVGVSVAVLVLSPVLSAPARRPVDDPARPLAAGDERRFTGSGASPAPSSALSAAARRPVAPIPPASALAPGGGRRLIGGVGASAAAEVSSALSALSVPVRRPDVHAVSKVNSSKVSNVVRIVRRRRTAVETV